MSIKTCYKHGKYDTEKHLWCPVCEFLDDPKHDPIPRREDEVPGAERIDRVAGIICWLTGHIDEAIVDGHALGWERRRWMRVGKTAYDQRWTECVRCGRRC